VMGSVVDYFKPITGSTFCQMLTSYNRHQWSPDGENWEIPKYHPDHLGGSAHNWSKDGRKYLSFWGSKVDVNGGCCHDTKSSHAAWRRSFDLYYEMEGEVTSDYSQTSGTYCNNYYGNYRSDFDNAKNACNRDGSCMGIYSPRCRKNNYRLCRSSGGWRRSRAGSCVFKKAAGTEATVGFPQMNVVTNENAVAMTKEEEILDECFGEELDDSQIQEGSGQEEIINVNNPNEESVGLGFGTSKIKTQENLLDIGYKSIAIFGLGLVAGSGLVALVLKNRKDPMKVSLLMDQEI